MLYQPLLSEHEKTRQRWYFGLFVLTLLWGGAFVYQNKHEIGEALAVGAPEDAVGSAAMYGYIHETPVGSNDVSKIEAEMNREGSKCGFTSVFKALPDGAAAEAAAEVFWANMVKAREAYKTGTVPDWKTILPTADIKPYLTGSGFPDVATGKAESPRTVLMLWSGDYTFNHAWRAMQQAYRLEQPPWVMLLGRPSAMSSTKGTKTMVRIRRSLELCTIELARFFQENSEEPK